MGKFWCGLDLGEATAHVCVVDADGAIVLETACPPHAIEIHQALSAFHDKDLSLIGMEAGGSPRLARELRATGYRVAVFEVRTVRRFLEAFHNKTDTGDAWGLRRSRGMAER